jgi:hypothetical protein
MNIDQRLKKVEKEIGSGNGKIANILAKTKVEFIEKYNKDKK